VCHTCVCVVCNSKDRIHQYTTIYYDLLFSLALQPSTGCSLVIHEVS
jgi:hypothetical protein